MIKALDEIVLEQSIAQSSIQFELIVPRGTSVASLDLKAIPIFKSGHFSGIPWEQLDLPRIAKGRLIINLANLGPIIATNSLTMIHDAQTFSNPDSYPSGFRAWYRLVQPILGKQNRLIFTVSNFSKQQLVKYGIATEEKIIVIYNGADHIARIKPDMEFINILGLRSKRFVLGLANAQPHKNIGILLKAFCDSRLDKLDLVLFGNADKSSLERLNGESLPSNIKLTGHISDEILKSLLQTALCFACPSITEGFGLPPLEAMFVGCPTLVAPAGALPEICGSAAVLVDPLAPRLWVENILALANDPSYWLIKSEAGKAHAHKFRWQKSASQLIKAVELLLSLNQATLL